jgi:uncharacterized protein
MTFRNPSAEIIRSILQSARTVAVVGYSPDPSRPSHRIASALQRFGYRIIPVRPGIESGLGVPAYPRLTAIPVEIQVDIVDVFRAPEHVPDVVTDCIARGLTRLWLQDDVVHEPAAERALAHGMTVVMNRCISRDYHALIGLSQ